MLLTKVISTVARAPLRPISKQRCRRRKGPRWSVRRALPQAIGSLIHPDLSCGAVSLPEDLTPRPLSSPCYGGLRVRIPLAPAASLVAISSRGREGCSARVPRSPARGPHRRNFSKPARSRTAKLLMPVSRAKTARAADSRREQSRSKACRWEEAWRTPFDA
jgi:hypothetical protein